MTRKQREGLSDALREAWVDVFVNRPDADATLAGELAERIAERIADQLEAEDPQGFNRAGWHIAADGAKKLRILASVQKLTEQREEQSQ